MRSIMILLNFIEIYWIHYNFIKFYTYWITSIEFHLNYSNIMKYMKYANTKLHFKYCFIKINYLQFFVCKTHTYYKTYKFHSIFWQYVSRSCRDPVVVLKHHVAILSRSCRDPVAILLCCDYFVGSVHCCDPLCTLLKISDYFCISINT